MIQASPSPRVSIVVPAYRVGDYIRQALRSLQDQTMQDWEAIVVDDGCPEESGLLANELGDARIRVIRKPNGGLASARNAGIDAAKAPIIALLDADDWWHAEKLEKHLEVFDRHPEVGVVFAGSEMVTERGAPMGIRQYVGSTRPDAEEIFLKNPIGNGSAPILRRATLDDVAVGDQGRKEYFRECLRQSEDIDCWLRIALGTRWQLAAIQGYWTYYRVNGEGLSANVEAQLASWQSVVSWNRSQAPHFFARLEPQAAALQCRYLARRSVQSGDAKHAIQMLRAAFAHSPSRMLRDFRKTLSTTLATAMVAMLPASARAGAVKLAGRIGA